MNPMEATRFAVVAQGDMQLLREVQRMLRSRGVAAHMLQPPAGCGSG
jgi:hypothetical protein